MKNNQWQYKEQQKQQRKQDKSFRQLRSTKRYVWMPLSEQQD